ncbi:MAG TPA: heterodisulfide reductase-related iron-sulfur binding cluster [Casimicrobiaceae bacterium]|nr:heterodisulfide reductase-related iron-sulfur binding cluster [Casimicrobiaceae bacterium]
MSRDADEARELARRNIDAWWPHVERGVEAIVVTASGCGVMVRDYGHLLAQDPAYAQKAETVAALARDPVETVAAEWAKLQPLLAQPETAQRIVFHPPCTLQHGMQIVGAVERLLGDAGYALQPVADAHLCCGSAGTYSVLQPEISRQLKANKLQALQAHGPELVATANIGCMTHLQSGAAVPVRHWIELIDERSAR